MKDLHDSLKVVILDYDSGHRELLKSLLVGLGHVVLCFESETICCENLDVISPDILFCITDGKSRALRAAYAIRLIKPFLPVVLISDSQCYFDEIMKIFIHNVVCLELPIEALQIRKCIRGLLQKKEKKNKVFSPLVGECKEIAAIRDMIEELKRIRDSIFIVGEKGTGRELIARAIVNGQIDERNKFVKIDSEQVAKLYNSDKVKLMENLLQIEKYAAKKNNITILISEIEKLPLEFQAGLLVLVDKSDNAVLSGIGMKFIVTAGNKIKALLERRLFRDDLFFRINVISLAVPPLRCRRKDVDLLVDYFTYKYCLEFKRSFFRVSSKAKSVFNNYHWPGNVEELENTVKRIVLNGNEQFILEAPPFVETAQGDKMPDMINFVPGRDRLVVRLQDMIDKGIDFSLLRICEDFSRATERRLIMMALQRTNWNRKKAARLMGISYKSILNKIKEYKLA